MIPADAMLYLRATAVLVAIWSVQTQLGWLANLAAFRPGGFLRGAGRREAAWRPLARVATWHGMVAVTVIRLAGAALLLFGATPALLAVGFALTLASALAVSLALDMGSGADKIGQIVAAAGIFAAVGLARGDVALAYAGTLLAGGQLVVCYAVSGIVKLRRRDWRSGRVLHDVMSSATYGHRHAARVTRSPPRALLLAWGVMLAEALFPLALLAPAPILWAALAMFLLFHWATAYAMGLNTFAWAFPAAFPAVLLLGAAVRSVL